MRMTISQDKCNTHTTLLNSPGKAVMLKPNRGKGPLARRAVVKEMSNPVNAGKAYYFGAKTSLEGDHM